MTITFYKKGDYWNYKELTDYSLHIRTIHGHVEVCLAPTKIGKFPTYRLDASEYIVEAK